MAVIFLITIQNFLYYYHHHHRHCRHHHHHRVAGRVVHPIMSDITHDLYLNQMVVGMQGGTEKINTVSCQYHYDNICTVHFHLSLIIFSCGQSVSCEHSLWLGPNIVGYTTEKGALPVEHLFRRKEPYKLKCKFLWQQILYFKLV